MRRRSNARLSGPVAEGLGHGDVAHSCRTGGLAVIEGLNPPGGPAKKRAKQEIKFQVIRCLG